MSQADNYTPQSVTGTTATLNVVLPWVFDGINELEITQTDGTTIAELEDNDFDAFVVGQIVTVENFFGDGNNTTITVSRATKKTQEFTQTEFNPLDAEALNQALDKIVRMIQDTAFKSDFVFDSLTEGELRELLLTAITSDDPFDIPAKDYRKNVYLGFDQNGELILTVPEGVTPPDPPPNPEAFLTVLTDIKVVSGTTYTLLDSDTGKFIIFTNVADVTVTSPADLTLGHQVMYLKTGEDNEIIHVADSGAEHVNDIPVIASKQYAWYSHTVFENTGGNAAKYRFIGEIDTTDTNNIELVSRTITIINGMTRADAQDLINTLGKYISAGVELKIVFEDTTSVNTQALLISDFTGPGILTIESLTPAPQDTTTARPVNITNSNVPSVLDYADPVDFENQLNWDSYLANSCMVISNNTCSQISIRGFSFSAKVFPVVMTGNTATMDIRYNFFNQINAFTLSEYGVAAGLKINGGMAYTYQNKYTTDTDTNGLLLHGCQIHLSEPAGEGGYLVKGGSGVAVAYDTGTFTPLIDLYEIDGFWSTDGQLNGGGGGPSAFPIGSSIMWNSDTPPDGWFIEDGSEINRSTYNSLFLVLGVTAGLGDGSSTFNIPDKRGRFPRFTDNGHGFDPDSATRTDRGDGVTGDNVLTLQGDSFAPHQHGIDTYGDGGSGLPIRVSNEDTGGMLYPSAAATGDTYGAGSETRPVNIYVNSIIKY